MQSSATTLTGHTMAAVAEDSAQVWSGDVDEMLASILPATNESEPVQTRHKAPRFRVKWHVDILIDLNNIHQGFINDISVSGASVFLASNVQPLKPTLRIYLPPLSAKERPHIIEVSGKTVYVVFDGDKQLYRAAISFTRFHVDSDLACLEERLNRYHIRIPEH